ncbi:MAG: superoxide dismutase [Polyangia bacterium]|nr:superoxide dismutase [Polyangia bacterium]
MSAGCQGAGAQPRPAAAAQSTGKGPFHLVKLPYGPEALAPHVSGRTVAFHYGKHHQGYLDKLNAEVRGTPREALTLQELIRQVAGKPGLEGLFNNAAQVWNHDFYWESMSPKGGGDPPKMLSDKLKADLGGFTEAKKALAQAAAAQFGSGWAWLVLANGRLAVEKTSNADLPITRGHKPLLCIDVWEHAYYLDWQNRRSDYIQAFLDHLVCWSFAEKNLTAS